MRPEAPCFVYVEPPRNARIAYKVGDGEDDACAPSWHGITHKAFQVVAIVHGVPTSIFDGVTTYPLGQTVSHMAREDHCGGLYCFPSVSS